MATQQPRNSGLLGRRVHIAGSVSSETDIGLIRYSHSLVYKIARLILENGGGLVLFVGKEPLAKEDSSGSSSLIFDWTALQAAADCLKEGLCTWPASLGPPLFVVTSGKAESEIPSTRRALWQELLNGGHVRLDSILPGARSGALIRQHQIRFADILLSLGGGTGVEHLADEYMRRKRPVIPLDLDLGSSRLDGTGGSFRLHGEARAEPLRFFRLQEQFAGQENARLAATETRAGTLAADLVADSLITLLTQLALPRAFYVRLLNPDHPLFGAVEAFFRGVVDPVVSEFGFERVEMGTDRSEYGFLNVGIFEGLHFASVVIVDVTGDRPNCFIELGYSLGRRHKILVTAKRNTALPFDQQAIPCHFWREEDDDATRRSALIDFWRKNINRAPLVGE